MNSDQPPRSSSSRRSKDSNRQFTSSRSTVPSRTDRSESNRAGQGRSRVPLPYQHRDVGSKDASQSRTPRIEKRRPSGPSPYELVAQRPLVPAADAQLPKIVSKTSVWHPFLFRKQLGDFESSSRPGDLVEIVSPQDVTLGFGLFNPRAEMTVRLLRTGVKRPDEVWWNERLSEAISLRRDLLKLDESTTAYRVIHAEADGLPGLVIDRFGDVLVAECYSLGMYQRAEAILALVEKQCGTKHGVLRAAPVSLEHEGFHVEPSGSEHLPARTTIHEHGTQFRIDFTGGHKTGFYCDQRDNRRKLASFCAGKSVLDLCCYTGGFAIQAQRLGGANEVTGVELDEDAANLARDNAKLNKLKLNIVNADAFAYMRDMLRNGKTYDVVILDPPKLIRSRDEFEEGKHKYYDLNRLAMQLVAPGGMMLSCSCSGLLDRAEFNKIICAAPEFGRRVQIIDQSGAAPDHPIATNCPEGEYLKTVWLRLE